MKANSRTITIAAGLVVFLGLPLLFYALGDAPRRSSLKEALSLLTLLSFGLMIGQFFLARSNTALIGVFKPLSLQRVHKYLAYGAITVIALHPALIVLPRFLEGGITPLDAFWTMITSFDNLGILLGLIGWGLMVVLGLTAFFRQSLLRLFAKRYRGWRYFHGGLAVLFTVVAVWHVLTLGRHVDLPMAAFYLTLIALGMALLVRLYWPPASAPSTPAVPTPTGEPS